MTALENLHELIAEISIAFAGFAGVVAAFYLGILFFGSALCCYYFLLLMFAIDIGEQN